MNVANLVASLKLNIDNFTSNMSKAQAQTKKFADEMKKSTDKASKGTKEMGMNFKDVGRIVQGIAISKLLYGTLNAIQNCTNAVYEFSSSLEYANMAYTNLFGSASLSTEFINVLQDFSATSPFAFTDIEAATKRLTAYGVEAKNLMYITQGIMAASSAQGNPEVIESISRAIGQIYTKGTMKAEEARQLAEAGIPVYKILGEKLGLTSEQLGNLGDQGIKASTAINALIDGMNEKFGGVLAQSSTTAKGLASNIKDNLLLIASEASNPIFEGWKEALSWINDKLVKLRAAMATGGVGGLFEALIPKKYQAMMRNFIGQIILFFRNVKTNIQSIGILVSAMLPTIINLFNIFMAGINFVITATTNVIHAILENDYAIKVITMSLATAVTMWAMYKAYTLAAAAVSAIITAFQAVKRAIAGIIAIMGLFYTTTAPAWVVGLALATAAVVTFAVVTGKAQGLIDKFVGTISKISGIKTDKILLPSQKERVADLSKFNEKLSDTGDNMSDLAESTSAAATAAKQLLSFDEVFSLNTPDETGTSTNPNSGILDSIGGMTDGFDIPTEDLMPTIDKGTVDEWGLGTVKKMFDSIKKKLAKYKDNAISAGIGAILGAAIGGIFFGPIGAKLGAVVGGLAGWFWADLADKLGLTNVQKIALPIGAVIGGAIGGVIGGVPGAAIGVAVGGLVAWIGTKLYDKIKGADIFSNGIDGMGGLIGSSIGTAIGFAVGGPPGAVIGLAIGKLAGTLGEALYTGFTTGNWSASAIGMSIGGAIGMGIGAVVAGPVGAVIGGAIGSLVGWVGGKFAENWTTIKDTVGTWATDTGSLIVDFTTTVGQVFYDWSVARGADITGFVYNGTMGFAMFCNDTASSIANWVTSTGSSLAGWTTAKGLEFSTWATNAGASVTNWATNTGSSIANWATNGAANISGWVTKTTATIVGWCGGTDTALGGWVNKTGTNIASWVTSVGAKISGWSTGTAGTIGNWATSTSSRIAGWGSSASSSISGACSRISSAIGSGFSSAGSKIQSWASSSLSSIGSWCSSVVSKISSAVSQAASYKSQLFSFQSQASGSMPKTVIQAKPIASRVGHAVGGVFNREHLANFAEGNKAEAIIPLENQSAMQPFVDAVARGITQTLAPIIANISGGGQQQQLQPVYVGTLIADDRGLKELERKMQVIRVVEERRGV